MIVPPYTRHSAGLPALWRGQGRAFTAAMAGAALTAGVLVWPALIPIGLILGAASSFLTYAAQQRACVNGHADMVSAAIASAQATHSKGKPTALVMRD